MNKVIAIFGTRPEAIKMAPLVNLLKAEKSLKTEVCVTGQHRHMLDQVLSLFEIVPDYDLNIMKSNQTLSGVTAEIITKLEGIFDSSKPDLVLVHGDTATTFAASLAAYFKKIPIAHIEAGLRTNNIYSPWPEEGNRRLTSCLSALNFCPTEISKDNLIREGFDENGIFITGNTVIDALYKAVQIIDENKDLKNVLQARFNFLNKFSRFILVTGHRRENFGDGFDNICLAIREISDKYKDVAVVYPVHLNPNVKEPVSRILSNISNVFLIDPLDYLPFVYLMSKSHIILTDSGGIQEEAPSLGKPVLVMRETTERPEALDAKTVKLVGTDKNLIVKEVSQLLDSDSSYREMAEKSNPYGDGKSSEKIISHIKKWFSEK